MSKWKPSNHAALEESRQFRELNNTQIETIDRLKSENAKLRELVRISIAYCNSGTCDECPIQGEDGRCLYVDMARELGVEVD